MCHISILDRGFWILDSLDPHLYDPYSLELFYLNFCVTLAVALGAFVLFTAFLFEDDDLVGLAVAHDSGLDRGVAADLCVFAFANEKGSDIYLFALFLGDPR